MNTERVNDYKISIVKNEESKNTSFYETFGEACVSVGTAGLAIEVLANQNPGLLVNAVLASAILFGVAIHNLPEYKG